MSPWCHSRHITGSKSRLVSPPYTGHLELRSIVELTNRSGFLFSSSVTHRLGGGTFVPLVPQGASIFLTIPESFRIQARDRCLSSGQRLSR